ncbi:MAG: hypothetical protein ACRD5L_01155, partial [Bryobacteraceae bacterium]
ATPRAKINGFFIIGMSFSGRMLVRSTDKFKAMTPPTAPLLLELIFSLNCEPPEAIALRKGALAE